MDVDPTKNFIPCSICHVHDVTEEKRKQDRREIDKMSADYKDRHIECYAHFERLDRNIIESDKLKSEKINNVYKELYPLINANTVKIYGLFVTFALLILFIGGSYKYTSDIEIEGNIERKEIVTQVVKLLTATAKQEVWQENMIYQLKQLNSQIKDINSSPKIKKDDLK